MIKPQKLREGDTIAVLSPSWGGPSVFGHIFDNGLRILEQRFKLKIKEFPTARMDASRIYENPKIRADDINAAFADKEIKAIITSIGGDDSIRILKYLNKKIIKENPKIFIGYSDTTTINTLLNQLGLVAFNGPAVMCGFSQMENFPDYEKHVKDILFNDNKIYTYKPYDEWTMKYPDWNNKENTGKIDNKRKNEGWHWIQGTSVISGKLFGGCIDVLEMIRGTEYWPKLNFWKGKILFIETSEDKPPPSFVKYALRNYGIQGILDNIKAIIVGRARDYSKEETKQLEENLIKIVAKEFNHPEMPIITNMDFGHTDPQFILPLGIKAEIDCKNKTLKLLESACTNFN
jgi:muramoyltetrapeptide carboxypeptidase LdcA involved in peptidoglycan recycling